MFVTMHFYCGHNGTKPHEARALLNAIRSYRAELQTEPPTTPVIEELSVIAQIHDDLINGLFDLTARLDTEFHPDGKDYYYCIDDEQHRLAPAHFC